MTTAMTHEAASAPMDASAARRSWTYVPVCDIVERDDEWTVFADLPGTTADNVDINFERGVLTIHAAVQGRPNEQQTNYLRREYGVGGFHRTFEIGEGIDADRIRAEFKHGVLTLHLPKADSVKPKKIAVKAD